MVENKRFDEEAYRGLPITDVPRLRELVETYKQHPEFTTRLFFSLALLGYYDSAHGGLDLTAGHILYRLSDSIDVEERKKMAVYPSEDGSIVIQHKREEAELFDDGEDLWDSLEDWRRLWEGYHRFIPEYQKHLPSGVVYEEEVPPNTSNVLATIESLFPKKSPQGISKGNRSRRNNDSPEAKERYWTQKRAKKAKRKS